MGNAQPSVAAPSPRLLSSPYLLAFLPGAVMALLGAFLAGTQGLAPKIEPVLLEPKINTLIFLVWALFLVITMLRGIVAMALHPGLARTDLDGWCSAWPTVRAILTGAVLLPMGDGLSVLARSTLWAMRLGAGL